MLDENGKPNIMVVYASLVMSTFALMGLALSASISSTSAGLRIILIACNSSLVINGIYQCFLYLKHYIDHRFQQLEVSQKRESASSLNSNVSKL